MNNTYGTYCNLHFGNILYDDIFLYITNFLSFNDIINLTGISQHLNNNVFNDIYFYTLAVNYYSKNFWEIAAMRSHEFSKPLKNYKLELIRIENFQKGLEKYNARRWTINEFYFYWNYQETYKDKIMQLY